MNELLQQLNKDTFPPALIQQFITWCVWEQARPSLALILQKVYLDDLAQTLTGAQDLDQLLAATAQVTQQVRHTRKSTGPLGLSAAEAAAYEMRNMLRAATEDGGDPESVAFFAARVCGWAAWAATDFTDPSQKPVAEAAAREAQTRTLTQLLQQFRLD